MRQDYRAPPPLRPQPTLVPVPQVHGRKPPCTGVAGRSDWTCYSNGARAQGGSKVRFLPSQMTSQGQCNDPTALRKRSDLWRYVRPTPGIAPPQSSPAVRARAQEAPLIAIQMRSRQGRPARPLSTNARPGWSIARPPGKTGSIAAAPPLAVARATCAPRLPWIVPASPPNERRTLSGCKETTGTRAPPPQHSHCEMDSG